MGTVMVCLSMQFLDCFKLNYVCSGPHSRSPCIRDFSHVELDII
jgi:hypothetical protein